MVIIKFTEPSHGRVAMEISGQLELKKLKAVEIRTGMGRVCVCGSGEGISFQTPHQPRLLEYVRHVPTRIYDVSLRKDFFLFYRGRCGREKWG